jgi:hypothetical protein
MAMKLPDRRTGGEEASLSAADATANTMNMVGGAVDALIGVALAATGGKDVTPSHR